MGDPTREPIPDNLEPVSRRTRSEAIPSALTGRLRRHLSVYAILWRNSVVREMMFKTNFLLWIVVELLWFGLLLCFIGVLYLHTESIAGWSKWQVVFLIGTSHFIQQIFH